MVTFGKREFALDYIRDVLGTNVKESSVYFVDYVGSRKREVEEFMVSRTKGEMLTYVLDEAKVVLFRDHVYSFEGSSVMADGFETLEEYHAYLENGLARFEVWRYWRVDSNREIQVLKSNLGDVEWDSMSDFGDVFRERVVVRLSDRGLVEVG